MRFEPDGLRNTQYNSGTVLIGQFSKYVTTAKPPCHVTLFSAGEYESLNRPLVFEIVPPVHHVYTLEPEGKGGAGCLVTVRDHAEAWRRSEGLGREDYHITLPERTMMRLGRGFGDLDMGMDSLLEKSKEMDVDGMDHFGLHAGKN